MVNNKQTFERNERINQIAATLKKGLESNQGLDIPTFILLIADNFSCTMRKAREYYTMAQMRIGKDYGNRL